MGTYSTCTPRPAFLDAVDDLDERAHDDRYGSPSMSPTPPPHLASLDGNSSCTRRARRSIAADLGDFISARSRAEDGCRNLRIFFPLFHIPQQPPPRMSTAGAGGGCGGGDFCQERSHKQLTICALAYEIHSLSAPPTRLYRTPSDDPCTHLSSH